MPTVVCTQCGRVWHGWHNRRGSRLKDIPCPSCRRHTMRSLTTTECYQCPEANGGLRCKGEFCLKITNMEESE